MPKEIYVSVDVETDGQVPGVSSMLSFGAVEYHVLRDPQNGVAVGYERHGSFTRNLELLPRAEPHKATAKFWALHPEKYAATRVGTVPPEAAMKEFHNWLVRRPGPVTLVGYPATFDHMWLYWYSLKFLGGAHFGFAGLDIKSYAMAALKIPRFGYTTKRNFPKEWFGGLAHTHIAVEDAAEQGELFCRMVIWHESGRKDLPPSLGPFSHKESR